MDQYRFLKAKDEIVFHYQSKDNIGQLNEKYCHAVIKKYLEWDENYHEIKIDRFIADICVGKRIYEIQTKNFHLLKQKLSCFLPMYQVQVVYPLHYIKYICYLDQDKKRRRVPRVLPIYSIFEELYKIKPFIKHPNFSLKIIRMNVEEYRKLQNQHLIRYEMMPLELIQEIDLITTFDYISLLPNTLPLEFTSFDLAKEAKISLSLAQVTLNVLNELEVVKRIKKQNRKYIYQINY